jgi:DNA-binding NarL/FixJ family response regulator
LEILQLLACGDSLKMVASKLKLSKKSIDGHKYRMMRKLNVKDRVLLSRLAIREGLIQP